jgi:hypothetical protein
LGRLSEATGTIITEGTDDDGGYDDTGNVFGRFSLLSTNLLCTESLRNVHLHMTFSQTVSPDSVQRKGGIFVLKNIDHTKVEGTLEVVGTSVVFTPAAVCPDHPVEKCFEANTDYTLVLDRQVVKSEKNKALTCTNTKCEFLFTTGSGIDTDPPSLVAMTAPEDGASIAVGGSPELLQAMTEDDFGVSNVDFKVDGDRVFTAGLVNSAAPENNLIKNGSFEIDENNNNIPDD